MKVYQVTYSENYILDVLIMFLINAVLIFRLVKTEGFGKKEHWFLNVLVIGEICALSDVLCVALQNYVNEKIFFGLNAVFYLSYIVLLYILLQHTKKICAGEKYYSGIGNQIIALIPMMAVIILTIASYWTGWAFYIDENAIYRRGEFYHFYYAMGLFFMLAMVAISVWHLYTKKKKEDIVIQPVFYTIPIFLGSLIQVIYPQFAGANIGLTCAYLIIFVNYYGAMIQRSTNEKNQKLAKAYHQLEEQYNIVAALSKNQTFVYYLDMQSGIYQEIKASDEFRDSIPRKGVASKELGKYIQNYVFPKHQKEMLQFTDIPQLEIMLKEREYLSCEYQRKDGEWRRASWTIASVDKEGKVTYILFAVMNITEEIADRDDMRFQLEKALLEADKATQAKSEFLHSMSHDIRTPMNAIIGYIQLMKKDIQNQEKVLGYLEKQEQAGEFLLALINNVLDMSKIESGNAELDEEYSYMGNLAEEIIGVFNVLAKRKHLTLKHLVHVEHPHILCDKTKVSEILSNLISNAVKYTADGGEVTVTTKELPSDKKGYILIQTVVEDTGIGMSKEFLPHIFDTFSRERNEVMGMVNGTGLGMPIVKKLVDLMEGTIEVESKLGVGSKFTVTLPHKIADTSYYEHYKEREQEQLSEIKNISTFQNKRILLAEDNEINAEIAIAILEDAGFNVERAEDGIVCVDKLTRAKEGTYDVILMDIQMPNMDGYKATKVIRSLPDKKKASIPIIAMTANAFKEDAKKCIETGMNAHLAKPLHIEEVLAMIQKFLF